MAGRIFVCPGQGSQAVGMGKELADAFPEAKAVQDAVDEALGEKLSELMVNGPIEELTLTRNAQPALMTHSLMAVRAIEAVSGKKLSEIATAVAGHSLGEYSALAAAGSLDVAVAAKLLRLRGESMQEAVPVGEGAMAALIGSDLETAQKIADAASEGEVCDIANDNGGGQVVLSGHKGAVERAIGLASDFGVRRAVPLPVSAPFHSSLMAPAADVMAKALAESELSAPSVPLLANVTAATSSDPGTIREQLVAQVTGRVRWRESMEALSGLGIGEVVEVGAGKVLSGIARRVNKGLSSSAVGTPEDVEAFVALLNA